MGGIGGAIIYYPLVQVTDGAMSAIFAIGIFLVSAVLASWNIQGTIEGFHDPKFKKWARGLQGMAPWQALSNIRRSNHNPN